MHVLVQQLIHRHSGYDTQPQIIADHVKSLKEYCEFDATFRKAFDAECIEDIGEAAFDYAVRQCDWLVDNLPDCQLSREAHEYRDNVLLA